MKLNELLEWHKEQVEELERETDMKEWFKFHKDAVKLLNSISNETFQEGVQYALEYLSDLYDGVMDTDLAKEYADKENN
jgi:hypothetical protein